VLDVKIKDNEPVLLEMSFTVIITEGTMPAYAQRVKRMEGESGRRLTMVAHMNMMRIDFLRLQIAHVLKAKMTGKRCVSGGFSWVKLRALRSDERMERTRRPGFCGQGDAMTFKFSWNLQLFTLLITTEDLGF